MTDVDFIFFIIFVITMIIIVINMLIYKCLVNLPQLIKARTL